MEITMVWLACSALAWIILADDWRGDFDITLASAAFITAISALGPLGLIVAVAVWVISRAIKMDAPVIWRRK